MAVPLTGYLSPTGGYRGFDIMPEYMRWCRRAITPRFANFHFEHADIFNREYNPSGQLKGQEFRFPYPDGTFDFAFATSVFTHLMPPDVAHYLRETARVLRPGGRCLLTFFLIDAEADWALREGRSGVPLRPSNEVWRTTNPTTPEECIAYRLDFVLAEVKAAGLVVREPIRFGGWSGRPSGFDGQDILLLDKPAG